MGICWYCYWGWAKPVCDVYDSALAKLGGNDSALEFGPSHIVWSDENWDDDCVDTSLLLRQALPRLAAPARLLAHPKRCCRDQDAIPQPLPRVFPQVLVVAVHRAPSEW